MNDHNALRPLGIGILAIYVGLLAIGVIAVVAS